MVILESAADLKLRREYFGGIAFHTDTGLSADLDRAAFQMLAVIKENGPVCEADLLGVLPALGIKNCNPPAANRVLNRLV